MTRCRPWREYGSEDCSGATGASLCVRRHAEHREPWRDPAKIVQRRVLRDALEEAADLEPPLLDVESEDRRLLRVGQLDGTDRLAAPSQPELAPAGGAHVAHPLRLAA